jgi:hypothetical protein
MKVLFDINVVLDIVGSRKPFYDDSRAAFLKVIESGSEPCLAIHAYPTIYYLLGAAATRAKRKSAMKWVLDSFSVAGAGGRELHVARSLDMPDFEDALVAAAASSAECDLILTRNVEDFSASPVKAMSPSAFLARQ